MCLNLLICQLYNIILSLDYGIFHFFNSDFDLSVKIIYIILGFFSALHMGFLVAKRAASSSLEVRPRLSKRPRTETSAWCVLCHLCQTWFHNRNKIGFRWKLWIFLIKIQAFNWYRNSPWYFRWYGTRPCCDLVFFERNNKIKDNFMNSFFSKNITVAELIRGFSTNQWVMSLNPAGDFKNFYLSKFV